MLKGITDAIIWIKKNFLHIMMTYLIYLMVIIIAGFLFKMLPDIAKVFNISLLLALALSLLTSDGRQLLFPSNDNYFSPSVDRSVCSFLFNY